MSSSDDSSDSTFETSSLPSSDSSAPPSPSKPRPRPPPLVGIDPATLVGKVLTGIRKSPVHPSLTLDFADNTTIQVVVDGYDPHPGFRGLPKQLETNAVSDPIFNPPTGHLVTELTIRDCAFVTLSDRAFDLKQRGAEWDQNHQGIAFKFSGQKSWHCIWATLAEHDENHGSCIFRSYNDVYLRNLHRHPPLRPQKKYVPRRKWK
jgi:hypothetical protein